MDKYVAESLADYVAIATSIAKEIDDVWFRGHASASYRLVPSVLRDVRPLTDGMGSAVGDGQIIISEGGTVKGISPESMFYEFKSRAVPFLNREPGNNFEWMFLMQHYGVPTRLLDWTTSALIALYFAIESVSKPSENRLYDCPPSEQFLNNDEFCSEGAAVFAISPSCLNSKTVLTPSKIYLCDDADSWEHYFDPMAKNGVDNFLPIAVQSAHIDTRIRTQSGHFTLHGANIWPLDYYDDLRAILKKIFIPHEVVDEMLRDLGRLGITESFIYPGLESLARDIKKSEIYNYSKRRF
ncbi:MAG: FRG domain-containing protein [Acidiferrobacter thiooxydans]